MGLLLDTTVADCCVLQLQASLEASERACAGAREDSTALNRKLGESTTAIVKYQGRVKRADVALEEITKENEQLKALKAHAASAEVKTAELEVSNAKLMENERKLKEDLEAAEGVKQVVPMIAFFGPAAGYCTVIDIPHHI